MAASWHAGVGLRSGAARLRGRLSWLRFGSQALRRLQDPSMIL